jgi:hypothetical protein
LPGTLPLNIPTEKNMLHQFNLTVLEYLDPGLVNISKKARRESKRMTMNCSVFSQDF